MTLRQKTIFDNFGLSMDPYQQEEDPYQQQQEDPFSQQQPFQPQMPQDYRSPPQEPVDYGGSSSASRAAFNFAPQTPPRQATPPPVPDGVTPRADWQSIWNSYTPETRANDRLNKLLDETPDKNNYRPGIARSIVAAGMGMGKDDAQKTMESVMYAPYIRDMASWKEKTTPFQAAASGETTANVNERNARANMSTAAYNADRLASQDAIQNEKNRIADVRAKAYAWKQMHPTWDWDTTGPTYVLKGPNGEIQDTGIKTGQMGEEDLQLLKNKGSVDAGAARGAAAVQAAQAGAVANNRDLVVVDGQTYQRNPDRTLSPVEGAPSGQPSRIGTPSQNRQGSGGTGAGGSAPNMLEFNRQKQGRLEQTYLSDPVGRQYVQKGNNGLYEMTARPIVGEHHGIGSLWGGGTVTTQAEVDAWDDLREYIDPNYKRPTPVEPRTGGRGGGPATGSQQQPQTVERPGIGPSTQPAPPKPTREETLSKDLQNPNLSPQQKQSLQRQLDSLNADSQRRLNREVEVRKLLETTPPGRAHDMLQNELEGLRPGNKDIEQKQRAIDFLKSHNKNVTEAAIQGVIDQGWVK